MPRDKAGGKSDPAALAEEISQLFLLADIFSRFCIVVKKGKEVPADIQHFIAPGRDTTSLISDPTDTQNPVL